LYFRSHPQQAFPAGQDTDNNQKSCSSIRESQVPQSSTAPNGIILKVLCAVAEAMHQNGVALHTTYRRLDKDADVTQGFIDRLLRSASCCLRGLLTLPRLLIRNVKLSKMVIRWQTLIAQITPNMQVAKPIQLWWELLFQHLVIMRMTTKGPTEKNYELAWERHDRVLPRMLCFFPR
jgi:hypothetical protein